MGRRWQHFWSRKVGASVYGGFMIAFATFAIPTSWLADDRVRVLCAILAVGCAIGAAYEWWFRPSDASTPSTMEVPRINAIRPRVRQAHRDPDGRVRLGLGPVSTTMTMRYAVLATFTNEPTAERPTRKANGLTVSVTGDPSDSASGFWLESFSRTIDLDQGEEASVVIAFHC